MAEVRVALWNCSGLLSGSSALEKINFLQICPSFDILILNETHHKDIQEVQPHLHSFSTSYELFHTEASSDDPYAGIVILVSKRLTPKNCSALLPGRILNLQVEMNQEELNLSAIYG